MEDLSAPELGPSIAHGFRPRSGSGNPERRKRDRFYDRIQEHPLPGLSRQEIDGHFRAMPMRYWERVTKAELIWGLETVHRFLHQDEARASGAPVVIADSRHYPERGFTKVMVCSRDRPGLLAKIAAAFSALRVNILRSDVYTRTDGLALDLFEVCDPNHGHLASSERVQHLVFLLEGALSDPPRFVSVWAGQFHKTIPTVFDRAPQVEFDNSYSADHTIVRLQTADRLGLLGDVLQSLTDSELNIDQAVVETENDIAADVFYVTDLKGAKIVAPAQLNAIRKALVEAVTS